MRVLWRNCQRYKICHCVSIRACSNGTWHKIATIKFANFLPQANLPNITLTNKLIVITNWLPSWTSSLLRVQWGKHILLPCYLLDVIFRSYRKHIEDQMEAGSHLKDCYHLIPGQKSFFYHLSIIICHYWQSYIQQMHVFCFAMNSMHILYTNFWLCGIIFKALCY